MMNEQQRDAVSEVLHTIQRCAILGFLKHMASKAGKVHLDAVTATEFLQLCIQETESAGEAPQNEVQWYAYGMRLMDKYGYPQEYRDEMMALITGLRGGL